MNVSRAQNWPGTSARAIRLLPLGSSNFSAPAGHGMHDYRPDALASYSATPAIPMERLEGLEELRFLSLGLGVSGVRLNPLARDAIELNNPTDKAGIEKILRERNIV